MKQEILKKVKEQLAKDYNCSVEDFDNRNNLITNIELNEGDRRYTDDKEILKYLFLMERQFYLLMNVLKNGATKSFQMEMVIGYFYIPI